MDWRNFSKGKLRAYFEQLKICREAKQVGFHSNESSSNSSSSSIFIFFGIKRSCSIINPVQIKLKHCTFELGEFMSYKVLVHGKFTIRPHLRLYGISWLSRKHHISSGFIFLVDIKVSVAKNRRCFRWILKFPYLL